MGCFHVVNHDVVAKQKGIYSSLKSGHSFQQQKVRWENILVLLHCIFTPMPIKGAPQYKTLELKKHRIKATVGDRYMPNLGLHSTEIGIRKTKGVKKHKERKGKEVLL